MKMNDNFHEFLLKIDKLILYIKNIKKYFKNQCLKFCLIFVNKFWDYLKKSKFKSNNLLSNFRIKSEMNDQEKQKKRNMLATSIASPFAGMIGKFVMHPVDTIKSKVQVNRMQLKSVSDYKSGTVTRLSNNLI